MEMNFRSTTRGLKLVKTKYMGLVEFETEYIPDWFLEEVLSRLPLKCVFRLKCVSKQWLSFISAPSFVNLYISRVSLSHKPQPWTVLSHRLHVKGTKFCPDPPLMLDNMLSADENDLIEYPIFSRYLYLPLPQRSSWRERYDIVAVSDGLVLYGRIVFMENSINHMTDYHLYNPITHQCVALPPPFLCFRFVSTGFLTQIEGGTLKNYKVVRFGCQLWEWHNLEFEIFCSEIGSWRSVVVHSDQAIQIAWLRMPFSFSGILHWIDRWLGIVACDPCRDSNQCRIIGLPSDIDKQCNNYKNNGLYSLCNVHQGRLRYFEVSLAPSDPFGFSGFSLWVLDDYDSATWSLLHRTKVTDILFDDILTSQGLTGSCPAPLAFHPFDGNIVCLSLGAYIVTYNAKTLKLEAHGNPVATEYFYESTGWLSWYAQVPPRLAFLYVLPPWPVSIPKYLSMGKKEDGV
uniref:Putative ovule protein n=1 Tax=Solanum chacoense TaxID=4108 RepID=A0A0V0IFD0_SOLCH